MKEQRKHKNLYQKKCKCCGKEFSTKNTKHFFCSKECQIEQTKKDHIAKHNKKFEGKKLGYDYVECAICGAKGKKLLTHILKYHGIQASEYKEKHDTPITCESVLKEQAERVKGDKNPAYNHGGKFSPFSKKFVNYSEEKIKATKEKAAKTKRDNPHKDSTKIEYYLHKGMSEEEAREALSERQSTFSLKKCIEKYGKTEGRKRWLDRQEKWHKSYKKSQFSKISQELFWAITDHLPTLDNIYFAELDEEKKPDKSGRNFELRLRLEKVILPDFIDVKQKKIIEFDGVYWHGNVGRGNKERDRVRKDILLKNGYEVLNIHEMDYKKDKETTITKCLSFLTQ